MKGICTFCAMGLPVAMIIVGLAVFVECRDFNPQKHNDIELCNEHTADRGLITLYVGLGIEACVCCCVCLSQRMKEPESGYPSGAPWV